MESILSLLFGVIGVTSVIVFNRSRQDLANYIALLFSLAVLILCGTALTADSEPSKLTLILVISLSGGFVLSRISKLRTAFWPWILPLMISFLPVVLGDKVFTYYAFDLDFRSSVLALLPLGVLLPLIGTRVNDLLKWFSNDPQDLLNALTLLVMGIGVFAGFFLASYYGILLIALGMTLASFFGIQVNRNAIVGALLIAVMPHFMELGAVESIDLSLGETIAGCFLGAFSVYFLYWLSVSNVAKSGVVIGIAISLMTLLSILFLGTQKTDLGGADAFIAGLIGIAAALTVLPSFRLAEALAPIVISTGIWALPLTVQPEIVNGTEVVKVEQGSAKKQEEPSLFEQEGMPVDSIIGDFKINEQNVQLNFQLGPKGGITKGSFKSFSGKVSIRKDVSASSFSVELPFAQLTTFNKYRDESLAEEGYFNAAKYPSMTFTSKRMIKKDGYYELEGNFNMLGVSKPLNIELKYVGRTGMDKAPVLLGRSSIDRTQYGMKPDSKEGNIVDFEFRIELIK